MLLEQGHQVEVVALGTESFLQLDEIGFWLGLDIKLDLLLHLVHIALVDGRFKMPPSLLAGHLGEMTAVDLPGVLALSDVVALGGGGE